MVPSTEKICHQFSLSFTFSRKGPLFCQSDLAGFSLISNQNGSLLSAYGATILLFLI